MKHTSPFPVVSKVGARLESIDVCPACGTLMEKILVNGSKGSIETRICLQHRVCLPQKTNNIKGLTND